MATLAGSTIASTYTYLLKMDGTSGLTSSLVAVQDGDATDSALKISTTSASVAHTVTTAASTPKALFIDANTSGVAAQDATGMHIDFDRTVAGSGTAAHNDIGIDLDVNSRSLGTSSLIGMDIDVVGHGDGTSTATGVNIAVGSADTNYALITSGGNVGIGASSPVSRLDVGGSLSGGQGVVGKEMLISQTLDTTYGGGTSGSWGGLMLNNNNSATDNRTSTGLHFTHGTSGVAGIVSTSTASQRADIRFITRGSGNVLSEKVKIDDDGEVTLNTGNLVIGTAGKGIDFSNQASPAGGMTSELLDHYEEGTYTPVAKFGASTETAGGATGWYTKIGNLATVQIRWYADGSIDNSGNLTCTLPFTTNAGSNFYCGGSLWTNLIDFEGSPSIDSDMNTAVIQFQQLYASTSSSISAVDESDCGANFQFRATYTYRTT